MKIAIIGAGAAGLAALRHCINSSHKDEIVCYEKTNKIGGTWIYNEETGSDQYGLPIHTSMYKNLRTNLPKEVMGYPDYPIPDYPESYLTRAQILDFLNSYCDNFELREFILFLHNVELVEHRSLDNREWLVKVRDLQTNTVISETFDAIMVCNGHYFKPHIPQMKGHDIFKGEQLHSHDYRVPETFANKTVIVIGAGPSGMDLALEISKAAKFVILSHHSKENILTKFPNNIVQKPDIKELLLQEVLFTDDTKERIDAILYCTGYEYSIPFLAENCGVRVDSNMITPLWKHIVSIENVTLSFIGLPFYVCAFSMFDLQVRFVLRFWHKQKQFPSKEDMIKEEVEEMREVLSKGLQKKHFHMMGPKQGSYYDKLANIAEIEALPPVLTNLHNECSMHFLNDLVHYREYKYKIIDDYTFIQV